MKSVRKLENGKESFSMLLDYQGGWNLEKLSPEVSGRKTQNTGKQLVLNPRI